MDDIEAIKRLKARYFRLLDTKDWAAFRDLFTPDCTVDVSGDGGGVFEGIDAFMAMLEPTLAGVVSVHQGHMPEIELTSDTSARGIWAMEDVLQFPPDGPVSTLHGWGHYYETYVKLDGDWRIQRTKLVRLRLDLT
jgi:uncharacterized protein (TIGR02246 family)